MDTETKTAANGISWDGGNHMGADYLVGLSSNGDIYEVYYNPNSNPTPCSWVNYGPDGDTGPNSGIAQGRGFATMQEAMKAAEENAMTKTASREDGIGPAYGTGHCDFCNKPVHKKDGEYVHTGTGEKMGPERRGTSPGGQPFHFPPHAARPQSGPSWEHMMSSSLQPRAASYGDGDYIQQAVNKGMMMGMPEFTHPDAMLPDFAYVVMEPGPNGARPTDRKTTDRAEANRWAQELLARTDWSPWDGTKHRASHDAWPPAPDTGQQCPSCRQYEVHHYDDNGGYNYCSNCDWSDHPERAHTGSLVEAVTHGQVCDLGIYYDAPYARCRHCGKEAHLTLGGRGPAVHSGTESTLCDSASTAKAASTGPLPEHLQEYWGKMTEDPRDNPNFCAKQSHKTPAIPWHNGMPTCLSCGKKATFNAGTGNIRYSTRSAVVLPEGDQFRWQVMAGDLIAITGVCATRSEAQAMTSWHRLIQPEPLAVRTLLAQGSVTADPGYLWYLTPVGLSIESAFFSPDSVTPVSGPEDGPKPITMDHAKHQQVRVNEANETLKQRGTPTIAPTAEPPKANETVASLNSPLGQVKQAVNEEAFGSERYQHIDRDFPNTGWAGSDGFNADHSSPAHNKPIPSDYRITGWPSAWGQGSPLAPSEGARHTAATGWLAAARNVVATNSHATVDGVLLDLFSASVMVQVYDGLSDANKAKFEAMSLPAAHDLAFKIVERTKTSKSSFQQEVLADRPMAYWPMGREAAFFDTDSEGDTAPGDSAESGSTVPMTTRPQVSPAGDSGVAGDPTVDSMQADPAANMLAPTQSDPSAFEQPTMAQRREAKISRMAKQIVTDNPQVKPVDADRLARMTVAQFPGVVAEG